jgi:hypothetical protein
MALADVVRNRLLKQLRVEHRISTAKVGDKTKLGDAPLGFSDDFVDGDWRHRVNRWFSELVPAFPGGQWSESSALGGVVKDVTDASRLTLEQYRSWLVETINVQLDRAVGAGTTTIPVAHRARVRDHLNVALLRFLVRDATLADLTDDRAQIIQRLLARMVA